MAYLIWCLAIVRAPEEDATPCTSLQVLEEVQFRILRVILKINDATTGLLSNRH